MLKNRNAYAALLRASRRIGWPTHFREDLTQHDKLRLMDMPEGAPFVWLVRPTGTWLIQPPWHAPYTGDYETWYRIGDGAILHYCRIYEQDHIAFAWDGQQLGPLKLDETTEWLCRRGLEIKNARPGEP